MEILRKDENQNLIINKEQDFQNNLGWEENMLQFEDEVLSTIINPIENYETVRYIHKPYDTEVSGLTFSQTDIWYSFYFTSGSTYTQDYNVVGIDTHENAKMLKQATESFFRLEFYKTPHISGTTYQAPTRSNRKLSFARNLSLPLGEKYFYTGNNINEDIFFPVFMGSNYRNKENMYLFWFQDESVLSESVLSGDTFWMTVKFYNANDGSIIDFVNRPIYSGVEIVESTDMYYKLVIDRSDYTYQYFRYTGTTGSRVGESVDPIKFYEKKGVPAPTPTPTRTPTPTPSSTPTPTPTSSPTATPTPTPSPSAEIVYNYYQYDVTRSGIPNANGGFFNYIDVNGTTQTILQNSYGYVGRYCMRENTYQNNQYNLYSISQVGVCGPGGTVTPDTGFTNANLSYGTTLGCTTNYDHTDGTVAFTNITKGIGSDVSAPYTVWMSGQTETGWTLVASGITEGGSTSVITNLKSDNGLNGFIYDPYTYAVKIVDTNGLTKISPSGVVFNCPTYQAIDFSLTYGCNGYAPTGGTFTVSGATGGSGTGYYAVITSPENYDNGTHHSLPFTLSGWANNSGNYWAISVYDDQGHGGNKAITEAVTCDDPPNATESLRIVFNTTTLPSASTFSSASEYQFELSSPYVDMCSSTTFKNVNATSGLMQGSSHWVKNLSTGNVRKLYYNGNGNDYFQTQGSCTTN